MDKRIVGYWVATGLFCAVYTLSGVMDLIHFERVRLTLEHLGYPEYLANILGPWKVAAVAVLLAPGARRIKEWAYAGAVFDLTGALASHLFTGDKPPAPVIPAVLLAVLASSYLLRPASRRLESPQDTLVARPQTATG